MHDPRPVANLRNSRFQMRRPIHIGFDVRINPRKLVGVRDKVACLIERRAGGNKADAML